MIMISWHELIERATLLNPAIRQQSYKLTLWEGAPVGHELMCIWNALEVAESIPGAQVLIGVQVLAGQVLQHHAAVLDPDGITAWEVTYSKLFDPIAFRAIPVKPKVLRRWGITATSEQARESAELDESPEEFEARYGSQCVVHRA